MHVNDLPYRWRRMCSALVRIRFAFCWCSSVVTAAGIGLQRNYILEPGATRPVRPCDRVSAVRRGTRASADQKDPRRHKAVDRRERQTVVEFNPPKHLPGVVIAITPQPLPPATGTVIDHGPPARRQKRCHDNSEKTDSVLPERSDFALWPAAKRTGLQVIAIRPHVIGQRPQPFLSMVQPLQGLLALCYSASR